MMAAVIGLGCSPVAPIGPSWPVDDTTTFDSRTLGSMHDCVSWFMVTSAQLVTTPATCLPRSSVSFTMRSSTAVALNIFTFGAASTLESRVEVTRAACLTTT